MPHRILAGNLWAVFNYGQSNLRYQSFLQRRKASFAGLVDSLVLHDQVVVPTDDFMSAMALIDTFGMHSFRRMITTGVLAFVRMVGVIGYVGNGAGLQTHVVTDRDKRPHPFCGPIDASVDAALAARNIETDKAEIAKEIIAVTTEIDMSKAIVDIKRETFRDIQKSPELRQRHAIRHLDLDRLKGIDSNQVRIYGGPEAEGQKHDEIGALLKLAHSNAELYAAEQMDCEDSSTSSPIGQILMAKRDRQKPTMRPDEAFGTLREIADVPDVGEAVLSKVTSLDEILRLRATRNAIQFRSWFHDNCRTNPTATGREYANLLKDVPGIDSRHSRIIRFLVTLLFGATYPVAGIGVSLVDSFVLSRLLRGVSPKYFIESLSQVASRAKRSP